MEDFFQCRNVYAQTDFFQDVEPHIEKSFKIPIYDDFKTTRMNSKVV